MITANLHLEGQDGQQKKNTIEKYMINVWLKRYGSQENVSKIGIKNSSV